MKWLGLLFLLLLLVGFGTYAEEEGGDEYIATQLTYDYLFLVEALIRHERYTEAAEELDGLLARVADNRYETALVHQTYGYVAIGLNDYPAAITHFMQAINSLALPDQVTHSLRYTTAQLQLQEDNAKAALQLLQFWFELEQQPPPRARVLLAQVYRSLARWKPAIKALKLAIKQSDEVEESWYQLLVGLYLETEQLKPAAELLQQMVGMFPGNAGYWRQLAGVLMQQRREKAATAVMALAAEKRLLKAGELRRLASLYLHQNMPLDAAELVETHIMSGLLKANVRNLSLLADAWVLAREPEKALPIFSRLSNIDLSGRSDLKWGSLLIELELWETAATRLQRGIERKKKPSARDWLLLGTSYARSERRQQAIEAFTEARDASVKKQERQQAEQWLEYLAAE
ncbi:MAG: transposase [gamma proteobacterium endosymbiont of Lamellibrachia anaximandri]|nr:transposase [gamma proteobacterium endosymbiont of Lamellibrachia anaximandri]